MSKLKLKTDQNGAPKSISQVSRLLRNKGEEDTEKEVIIEVQEQDTEIPVKKEEKQTSSLLEGTKLENMLLDVKQKRGLNIERRPIMVDAELYSIFAMLKAKKMVPAAGLVSLICRNWVKENKEELEHILGQKIDVQ